MQRAIDRRRSGRKRTDSYETTNYSPRIVLGNRRPEEAASMSACPRDTTSPPAAGPACRTLASAARRTALSTSAVRGTRQRLMRTWPVKNRRRSQLKRHCPMFQQLRHAHGPRQTAEDVHVVDPTFRARRRACRMDVVGLASLACLEAFGYSFITWSFDIWPYRNAGGHSAGLASSAPPYVTADLVRQCPSRSALGKREKRVLHPAGALLSSKSYMKYGSAPDAAMRASDRSPHEFPDDPHPHNPPHGRPEAVGVVTVANRRRGENECRAVRQDVAAAVTRLSED